MSDALKRDLMRGNAFRERRGLRLCPGCYIKERRYFVCKIITDSIFL